MFTLAWWYMLATYLLIWAGVLSDPIWIAAAIGLCLVQAAHFGLEDKSLLSLSCQVRYVMAGILALGLIEGLGWIYWIPLAGLTVRLTVNYCLLARLVSLLPWNLRQPLTRALVKQTIFSKPVKGCILRSRTVI